MRIDKGIRAIGPWLFAAFAVLATTAAGAADLLTPAQLKEDLRVFVDTIRNGHPDIAYSVAPADLDRALASLERDLDRPLTRDEAWQRFARINPVIADAHCGVFFDEPGKAVKAHLAGGGGLFPFEVHIDADDNLFIAARLGGEPTPLARTRITRIDGVDSRRVVRKLLALVHGDTPAFRARLLAERWYFYYWKMYGAPERYDLALDRRDARRRVEPAGRVLPQSLATRESFEQTYRFELLPDRTAWLTANSFAWPDADRWFAFADDAFGQMRRAGTRRLIIDVRNNGGGNDDFWMRGLLRHIADKPYRWASTYRKRVMEADPAKGEAVGDVVDGEIARRIEPERDDPLRFDGEVVVLVGPGTYSSSVLFANVVQDYGFGKVAGARGGIVRSRQSGGTRDTTLPHSGLVAGWPRFILDRPAGAGAAAWLTPDLVIRDDPFDARVAVDAIAGMPVRQHESAAAR